MLSPANNLQISDNLVPYMEKIKCAHYSGQLCKDEKISLTWLKSFGMNTEDLMCVDRNLKSILSIAAGEGHLDLVKEIICEVGTRLLNVSSIENETPLYEAIGSAWRPDTKANYELVDYLLSQGAHTYGMPMVNPAFACETADSDIHLALEAKKKFIEQKNPIKAYEQTLIVALLLRHRPTLHGETYDPNFTPGFETSLPFFKKTSNRLISFLNKNLRTEKDLLILEALKTSGIIRDLFPYILKNAMSDVGFKNHIDNKLKKSPWKLQNT